VKELRNNAAVKITLVIEMSATSLGIRLGILWKDFRHLWLQVPPNDVIQQDNPTVFCFITISFSDFLVKELRNNAAVKITCNWDECNVTLYKAGHFVNGF
jgi:hypothetical protein